MDVKGVQKVNIERKCEFVVCEIVSRLKSKVKVCVFKKLNVAKTLSQYDIEMCGLCCMLFNYIYCIFCDESEL